VRNRIPARFARAARCCSQNNDGCVIARSAEAKPFVTMGEPYFKQKDAFRRHGIVAFSSNYELYADMSNRVMTTLEEMSPRVEIYH
jgi:DNA polymerase V